MRRREFIRLLGGAMAWPLAARAQHVVPPVVGYLGMVQPDAVRMAAFRRGLSEESYVEGHSLTIEFRWAEGR
jgi:putative ABC transport system substrate-binding protein